jgi:hypothetical protein
MPLRFNIFRYRILETKSKNDATDFLMAFCPGNSFEGLKIETLVAHSAAAWQGDCLL